VVLSLHREAPRELVVYTHFGEEGFTFRPPDSHDELTNSDDTVAAPIVDAYVVNHVGTLVLLPLAVLVALLLDATVSNAVTIDVALAQFGRERPEAQPGGFWADQRPKTGGRSRPSCARRETRRGLAALSI